MWKLECGLGILECGFMLLIIVSRRKLNEAQQVLQVMKAGNFD